MLKEKKKYLAHGCHQAQTDEKEPSLMVREAVATIHEEDDVSRTNASQQVWRIANRRETYLTGSIDRN